MVIRLVIGVGIFWLVMLKGSEPMLRNIRGRKQLVLHTKCVKNGREQLHLQKIFRTLHIERQKMESGVLEGFFLVELS